MNQKTRQNKSPHAAFKNMADEAVALQILEIIETSPHVTQRSIKSETGLAAGLVHSYMRKVINKGWVKSKQVSPKRWLYYLTPEGFFEKSRLTIKYLSVTLSRYRETQNFLKQNLTTCIENGWRKLIVAGDNDLAEISAINIKAMDGLSLVGIVSNGATINGMLVGEDIRPYESIDEMEFDRIFVCDAEFLDWFKDMGRDENASFLINL